jgi:uncharacterized membrane protein
MAPDADNLNNDKRTPHPFRQAVLRGLGVVFPPLLTILIFLWVINTTRHYVLEPVTSWVRNGLVWRLKDIREDLPLEDPSQPIAVLEGQLLFGVGLEFQDGLDNGAISGNLRREFGNHGIDLSDNASVSTEEEGSKWQITDQTAVYTLRKEAGTLNVLEGHKYHQLDDGTFIPQRVFLVVESKLRNKASELSGEEIYASYVDSTILLPYYTIPFFLATFILLLYLLGKFMAAGIGRFFVHRFERGIHRLPLIRNVYSSVKQVSDFLFSEPEIEYMRVVAVEYPRKGIWSLGLVTGESMLDIRAAANEPILSVLMPTSPMPVTGFTVTIRKSETIDLNITIDQAFQFIVSCGVVVPPQQLQQMRATTEALPAPADSAEPAPSGEEVVDSG